MEPSLREKAKKITVISQLRFSEDVLKIKKLIGDGAFGKITLCNLFMKYYRSREYYSSSPWKGKLAFDGGGALMNQGIQFIRYMQLRLNQQAYKIIRYLWLKLLPHSTNIDCLII